MSKVDLGGHNLKEISLIILLIALAFIFVVVGVAFVIAVMNDPSQLVIAGEFDLSQFTGIIIGIAMVAVTMVAQQLTARNQAQIAKQTDESWAENEQPKNP